VKPSVLLDTGPLLAFIDARDQYHDWVRSQFALIQPPLQTCEPVWTEACFLAPAGRQSCVPDSSPGRYFTTSTVTASTTSPNPAWQVGPSNSSTKTAHLKPGMGAYSSFEGTHGDLLRIGEHGSTFVGAR